MTNGVRGRGPRFSGGTAGGAAPYASGTAPDSTRSPFAGLVRFGTAPGPTVSLFRGLPKPHDARSVSPDVALRTPPRPGRAPHELVRAARASHCIAGCGLRHGKLPGPARETEAQVDRGSYIVTNPRGVRGTGLRHLRPYMGGPSQSPRQARRQHNLNHSHAGPEWPPWWRFPPQRSAPGPPGGRLRMPAGAPSVNIKLFTRRLASLRSVSWSRTKKKKSEEPFGIFLSILEGSCARNTRPRRAGDNRANSSFNEWIRSNCGLHTFLYPSPAGLRNQYC